jgi:alkylhydroperoxidase/carboxymuconolactone decarboxylase family protein YurZ
MDPAIVELQETMRSHAMNTPHLEPKVVQLMLFGMLLMDGNDAAETHAIASRREGASWEELQSVISLCFLFRGLPAANRGADMLASVAEREANAASPSKA